MQIYANHIMQKKAIVDHRHARNADYINNKSMMVQCKKTLFYAN